MFLRPCSEGNGDGYSVDMLMVKLYKCNGGSENVMGVFCYNGEAQSSFITGLTHSGGGFTFMLVERSVMVGLTLVKAGSESSPLVH